MNITIHKHVVPFVGQRFVVNTHAGAEALTTQFQNGQLVFWMRVNTWNPFVRLEFVVVGTGHDCPANGKYVGTSQDPGTGFVWHLFAL